MRFQRRHAALLVVLVVGFGLCVLAWQEFGREAPPIHTSEANEDNAGQGRPVSESDGNAPAVERAARSESDSVVRTDSDVGQSYSEIYIELVGESRKRPLPGRELLLLHAGVVDPGRVGVTDNDGMVTFKGLEPGSYSVCVPGQGYSGVGVRAGERVYKRIEVKDGAVVRGVVVDENGARVGHARILATAPNVPASSAKVAEANERGEFTVKDILEDTMLAAHATGCLPCCLFSVSREILDSEKPLELVVRRDVGSVLVQVFWGTAPVQGAQVVLGNRKGWPVLLSKPEASLQPLPAIRGVTDENGCVAVDGVPSGDVSVSVLSKGFAPNVSALRVQVGRTSSTQIVLGRGASVTGSVVDDGGNGLSEVHIMVIGEIGVFQSSCVTTGNGSFCAQNCEVGNLRIFARTSDGVYSISDRIVTYEGRTTQWQGRLPVDYGVLRGSVEASTSGHFRKRLLVRDPESGRIVGSMSLETYDWSIRVPKLRKYEVLVLPADGGLAVGRAEGSAESSWMIREWPVFPDTRITGGIGGAGKVLGVWVSQKSAGEEIAVRWERASRRFDTGPIPPGVYRVDVSTEDGYKQIEANVHEHQSLELGVVTPTR